MYQKTTECSTFLDSTNFFNGSKIKEKLCPVILNFSPIYITIYVYQYIPIYCERDILQTFEVEIHTTLPVWNCLAFIWRLVCQLCACQMGYIYTFN